MSDNRRIHETMVALGHGTALPQLPRAYQEVLGVVLAMYHGATVEGPHVAAAFLDYLREWPRQRLAQHDAARGV
jgi:hypothetical protein